MITEVSRARGEHDGCVDSAMVHCSAGRAARPEKPSASLGGNDEGPTLIIILSAGRVDRFCTRKHCREPGMLEKHASSLPAIAQYLARALWPMTPPTPPPGWADEPHG
jgi:hypothetical protein